MKYALWIVQGLLALVFVFAGSMKLITPVEVMQAQSPLPGLFIQFIGVAELLGGLGLVLPTLVRIKPILTTLAAIELVHVMIGATILTLANVEQAPFAAIPAVVGALCAFVAYGRTRRASSDTRVRRLDTHRHAAYSAA
jgi:uncharacterized membrane protein YphA (DoxX/SURF4 family)